MLTNLVLWSGYVDRIMSKKAAKTTWQLQVSHWILFLNSLFEEGVSVSITSVTCVRLPQYIHPPVYVPGLNSAHRSTQNHR